MIIKGRDLILVRDALQKEVANSSNLPDGVDPRDALDRNDDLTRLLDKVERGIANEV